MSNNCTCNICLEDINLDNFTNNYFKNNDNSNDLNDNKDNDILKLKCNHHFHKKCFHKWIDFGNNTCPLCRRELINLILDNGKNIYNSNELIIYKNNYKCSDILHNLKNITNKNFNNKILINQDPIYYIKNIKKKWNYPIYKLNNINIDYYLRFLIINNLYQKNKVYSYENNYGSLIYTSRNNSNKLLKKDFEILLEWIHQIFTTYNKLFLIKLNSKSYNIIVDLLYNTIIKFDISNKSLYQTLAIAVIYNILNLFNVNVNVNEKNSINDDKSSDDNNKLSIKLYIRNIEQKNKLENIIKKKNKINPFVNIHILSDDDEDDEDDNDKKYYINLGFNFLNFYTENSSDKLYYYKYLNYQKSYISKNYIF